MSYGILVDEFWTGATGRALRRSKDARILAAYLFSAPGANMLGLYHLAIPTACHHTGLTTEEVQLAMERYLRRFGVALYDPDAELVWVVSMARIRLGLEPGARLAEKDKRVEGVRREIQRVSAHPFAAMFVERYGEQFQLGQAFAAQIFASVPPLERQKWALNPPLPRLLEGDESGSRPPSKALGSPLQGVLVDRETPSEVRSGSDQDQDQDQRGEGPPVSNVRTEPDNPYNLLQVMRVVANRRRPELGLWSPGKFADRDAVDFYRHIPKASLANVVPLIRKRVERFFDEPDSDGWPLGNFLRRFNALGAAANGGAAPKRFDPGAEVR